MRTLILLCPLLLLPGLAATAQAEIGTLDRVPAATLLLPYFEVDPVEPTGVTTLFTIRNASDGPVVAHVTLWSNLSVPVLDFDVYLTGYDSQAINLRDVFVRGRLPITAPSDTYSPRGPRSKPHDDFRGSCDLFLPYDEPAIPPVFGEGLRAALTGQPSLLFGGNCAGTSTELLVGYLTIDAVNECNLHFPSSPEYFGPGGTGIASNRNVLWGDWQIVDLATNEAQGEALVAIEASSEDPLTSTPGNRTFYGRYVGGSAADNREPLASTWHAGLDTGALPDGEAELLVWRDSGIPQVDFPCGPLPSPFPLTTKNSIVYDPEGAGAAFPSDALPRTTQRVTVAPSGGSLALDLDISTGSVFDPNQQGHVTVLHKGAGALSTGAEAVQGEPGMLGTADAAPGATLLLPYFEVDLSDPSSHAAWATAHNASPDPVLARAVLWTDRGVPTFGFDLLLPGHGSQVLDLGELFGDGVLPQSGEAGAAGLPGCSDRLPPPPLSGEVLDGLRAAHTGTPSSLFEDRCAGHDHGDARVRGYLTVDVVTSCSAALPGDPEYFGLLGFDDVLWGDVVHREAGTGSAHGGPLVHLQASTDDPATGAGRPTFYGRYTAPTATDHREALPDRWGAHYFMSGAFLEPEYQVWRDTGRIQEPFDCAEPAPLALGQGVSLRFDADGFDGILPSPAASLATQRTIVPQPTVPGSFGWLFLDLDAWTGGPFGTRLQSHVTGITRFLNPVTTSAGAIQLPLSFGTTVSILATDPEAAERSAADPAVPDPGEITLGRTGPVDQLLDVLVSVSGTATEGTDYEALGGTLVTFPAGVSTLSLTVQPVADAEADDGETVVLTLEPGVGYSVDVPPSATVTIRDRLGEPEPPVDVLEIPSLGLPGLILLMLGLLGAGVGLIRRG